MLDELKKQPQMVLETAAAGCDMNALVKYQNALAADPVGGTRSIVAACRASGQRRAALKEVIQTGNATSTWNDEITHAQLLRDCETRWSSTRNMVARTLEIYPVSIHITLVYIY